MPLPGASRGSTARKPSVLSPARAKIRLERYLCTLHWQHTRKLAGGYAEALPVCVHKEVSILINSPKEGERASEAYVERRDTNLTTPVVDGFIQAVESDDSMYIENSNLRRFIDGRDVAGRSREECGIRCGDVDCFRYATRKRKHRA